MSKIAWLHLSDWYQKGKEFDRDVVRDALLKDIENRTAIAPELEKIDFIIFSGDVARNGKKEEYEAAAEQLFEPLLEKTGVPQDRLFIVPGNHDPDRGMFDRLPQEIALPFRNCDSVNKWLANEEYREDVLKPFFAFEKFVSNAPCILSITDRKRLSPASSITF